RRPDEVPSTAPVRGAPLYDDPALPATRADETPAAPHPELPDPFALMPWVDSFEPIALDPSAPARSPFRPLPLEKPKDVEVIAARSEAERLLRSRNVTSGDQARQAMQLLVQVPDDQRARVIDGLDQRSFENLIDRIPDSEKEQFAKLVESSQDPKRKLKLWAAMHVARANNDLDKYKGDFGSDDDRTDEQDEAKARYDRRSAGVASTKQEVDAEVARMLAKDKEGKLTLADVDDLRARKDLELNIEMKYNVNLVAETTARGDGSQVMWTKEELADTDATLARLPPSQVSGPKGVPTFIRRANRGITTKGGEYLGDHIDIYDNAHRQGPETENVDTFAHAVTHEIGHDVAADHHKAFEKFEKAAGWETVDDTRLAKEHVSSDKVAWLDRRRRRAQDESEVNLDITQDGKLYQPTDVKGKYYEVPVTAFPNKEEWRYGKTNPGEQFAEMYAKAVDEPQTIYNDFVAAPQQNAKQARAKAAQDQAAVKNAPSGSDADALRARAAESERAATEAERVAQQRDDEFSIMRNDVFHTDKAVAAAKERLRQAHAKPAEIAAFEARAAQVSTPEQVAELERQVKK
ncbi:MAG: hypothetical protein ACM31C_27275, partial [Acidobacteriota bacterium]